jgi:hypothetical protein
MKMVKHLAYEENIVLLDDQCLTRVLHSVRWWYVTASQFTNESKMMLGAHDFH